MSARGKFESPFLCSTFSNIAGYTLTDYASILDPHVKKRYLEKISCVGIDPVLIPDKTYDQECLPPVKSMDLLSFLCLTRVITVRTNLRLIEVCSLITNWFQGL